MCSILSLHRGGEEEDEEEMGANSIRNIMSFTCDENTCLLVLIMGVKYIMLFLNIFQIITLSNLVHGKFT